MRVGMNGVSAACAFAAFALPFIGQSAPGSLGSGTAAPRVFQPYTARFKVVSVQTLANGTTITHESTEIQAVDSEGRRLNVTITPASGQMPERSSYRVSDPAARTNMDWMVPGKNVMVRTTPLPSNPGQRTCWSSVSAAGSTFRASSGPSTTVMTGLVGGSAGSSSVATAQQRESSNEISREDLGEQTIQGVLATGTRTTVTTPAGAVGNDAPLVRTMEVWMAKSIGVAVRSLTDDPRTGKRNRELVELSQGEPDPSIFRAPEGYQVVNQEMHEVPCEQ